MKIIKNDKEKLVFVAELNETLANAIRRSVNEIQTLAIDEVTFYKNDSALYDELIAHRLGLIPIEFEKLQDKEKCTCKGKGCGKCTAQLKLVAQGPKMVESSLLKGTKVIYDKMPIVLLTEGQELELTASARMGKGVEHIKYLPGLVYYRNVAEIQVNKECDSCKECVKACPQNILAEEKGKIKIKDVYKCDLCEACVESCKKHGENAIKIIPGKEIIFFIESYGSITPKDILVNAVKALESNLDDVMKEIK